VCSSVTPNELDSGVYVVWLYLPRSIALDIGRLGRGFFAGGVYAYCGSAQKSLQARLRRHQRVDKPLHWHVDFFRKHSYFLGAVVWNKGKAGECMLARELLKIPGARYAMDGFGASDCRCRSHFLFLPEFLPRFGTRTES